MRSMWVALVLLVLYLLLVFLGSRIIDLVLWCHQGTELVDPFVLSVRQLKLLLENRGVSYTGYVEKQELAHLVKASADVTAAEVTALNDGATAESERERLSTTPSSSQFVSSAHFYEQVEDTKDSVWLVQVIPAAVGKERSEPLLDDYNWRVVRSHVAPFAIRTGILDCNYGRRLCRSKGWFEPLLLLALPKGTTPKDKVILRSSQLTRPQAIIEWLREELSIRVQKVANLKEAEEDWLNKTTSDDVKVLLLTHLFHPPLFLAALSIKFTGRIKFGMMTVKKEEEEELLKKRSELSRAPSYVVVAPEKTVIYGHRRGEHFNFWAMNAFLCSVQPEINDIFLCTLILVNMIVTLQILQVCVDLWWKRVVCALWTIVSHNLFLFWAWIIIFSIHRWPVFSLVANYFLVFARWIGMSDLGALLRADCQLMARHQLLFTVSFCIFGYFGQYLLMNSSHIEGRQRQQRAWWEVLPLDCLFRPITSRSRPMPVGPPIDIQLEEGIEMLIERLAVPNLWLPPVHSSDYIKDLLVWKFKSGNDKESSEETDEEKLVKLMDDGLEVTPTMIPTVECAVCLENYQSGELLCGLPCGHNYHQKCLVLWLQTDNHHCPICRWPAYKAHPRRHKQQ